MCMRVLSGFRAYLCVCVFHVQVLERVCMLNVCNVCEIVTDVFCFLDFMVCMCASHAFGLFRHRRCRHHCSFYRRSGGSDSDPPEGIGGIKKRKNEKGSGLLYANLVSVNQAGWGSCVYIPRRST